MNITEKDNKIIQDENSGGKEENKEQKASSRFDKIRKFFDEIDFSDELPEVKLSTMTIIAISCVIIAFCAVFIAFNQFSLAKAIRHIANQI